MRILFAETLRKLRTDKGLSQRELAERMYVTLCRTLLTINPRTNVVYLTAYIEYSFDAWSTGASGFTLKPITTEGIRAQLKNLRYPFSLGGADD